MVGIMTSQAEFQRRSWRWRENAGGGEVIGGVEENKCGKRWLALFGLGGLRTEVPP